MSRPTVVQCDECGTIKKQANHWYTARLSDDGGELIIGRLKEGVEPPEGTADLCSHECLFKAVNKWMMERS